jgi:hypothetical protein
MKKKVILGLFPILTIWLALPIFSEAQVFKWVGKTGDIHYTDKFHEGPRHKKTLVPPPKPNLRKNLEQKKEDSKNLGEAKDNLIHLNKGVTQCKDLAKSLDQCLPYTCQQSQPLFRRIIINHIISGMKDGKCRYEQTISMNELVTCEFSENQRKKFAQKTKNMFAGNTVEGEVLGEKVKLKPKVKMTEPKNDAQDHKVGHFMDEALRSRDCFISGLEY